MPYYGVANSNISEYELGECGMKLQWANLGYNWGS
jgi:hypothetical protein